MYDRLGRDVTVRTDSRHFVLLAAHLAIAGRARKVLAVYTLAAPGSGPLTTWLEALPAPYAPRTPNRGGLQNIRILRDQRAGASSRRWTSFMTAWRVSASSSSETWACWHKVMFARSSWGGISSQRKALDTIEIEAVAQSEENSKACLSKDSVRWLQLNMIP